MGTAHTAHVPYVLVACGAGIFRFQWFAIYALLPFAIAALLMQAGKVDPEQRGNWRDFLILAVLGLAVDLRWFEGAWPAHLAIFNKILLLDAGIYGFVLIRRLEGTSFACAAKTWESACGRLLSTFPSR